MTKLYPWQRESWQHLLLMKKNHRLPHALLIQGPQGIGKKELAHELTYALLCNTPKASGEACHDCHMCRLILGKVHPNILWIEPLAETQSIKVDQIREGIAFLNQSGLQNGFRIIIIHPAHQMNINAANALLKTLEEPSAESLLILLSDQSTQLPATIRSRCQSIHCKTPDRMISLNWLMSQFELEESTLSLLLNIAKGAPLAVCDLINKKTLTLRQQIFNTLFSLPAAEADPVTSALSFQDEEPIMMIDFILSGLMDLLKLQLGVKHTEMINRDYFEKLNRLKNVFSIKFTSEFLNEVQNLRKDLSLGLNMNKQLMLEYLFIRWAEHKHHVSC